MKNNLLSCPEAAKRIGISRHWMATLCRDGRVDGAFKVGRAWLIPQGARVHDLVLNMGRPMKMIKRVPGSHE